MLTKTVSSKACSLLASLIGEEFKFVGGVNLPEYLVSDNLVVETSGQVISIYGDIEEEALGINSLDDFSFLVVEPAEPDEIVSVHNSGNMYLLDKRARIKGVSLIRNQISMKKTGDRSWELAWDSGIVLHLETGSIVVNFLSLSSEVLRVDFLDEFSLEEVAQPTFGYEDSLLSQFQVTRTLIDLIQDAVSG